MVCDALIKADPYLPIPDGKGGAWVAWVWDYHGTMKKKVPVGENSVFARRIDPAMKLGEVLAAGYRFPPDVNPPSREEMLRLRGSSMAAPAGVGVGDGDAAVGLPRDLEHLLVVVVGIVERIGQPNPGGVVLGVEVVRQVRPLHQVEEKVFHEMWGHVFNVPVCIGAR